MCSLTLDTSSTAQDISVPSLSKNSSAHLPVLMARSKQAMPVRRAPSSEYISKQDRFPKNATDVAVSANGNGNSNGSAQVAVKPRKDPVAGVFQLLVCVGGIYASL